MRVLQICNYFYPNIGGIEQVARDISGCINGRHEQMIICFNETASDGSVSCRRDETVHDSVDGVDVIRCGCFSKVYSQSVSLPFGRELERVMESFSPDTVIFHYPNPYQAVFLEKYLDRDFRFILYWHSDIIRQRIANAFLAKLNRRLLERADTIVATSPPYIDGSPFLSRYKEKCVVIPNCIDENRFELSGNAELLAEKIREENKDKIICFSVGRHIPYKGFSYLIKASKLLDDRFRIYIAGQGPLTESLKKEASGDNKIVFPGRVNDETLFAYYRAMDIFCFPSITKNEAFGIALAEAMSFGKPAITFEIPGSGVNYVNENGMQVGNADWQAYAEAIKTLGENETLRIKYGQDAQSRVRDLFTQKIFEKNISELIG